MNMNESITEHLSADKKKSIKIGLFAVCLLFTVIYGILTVNACIQREQEWDERAKDAFFEALESEMRKMEGREEYCHTATSLFQQITLKNEIPDSIVISSQNGSYVHHLPLHKRNNAYFKDGSKNAFFSTILEQYPFLSDSLCNTWNDLLSSRQIKADIGVCSQVTDLSGHTTKVNSASFKNFTSADSLVSTYLGYRLEMELSGYVSYTWWNLLPVGMIMTVALLWGLYILFLLSYDRLNQLISKQPVVMVEKVIEKTPSPVNNRKKNGHILKSHIYKLDNNVYFDAGQHLFCDDNGIIEKLSPNMSILLEHFFKAPNHTLTKYEIYQILGKDLEKYSLDNFYKMIERFRKKLEKFSSATLHNGGNGSYQLILPLRLTDMN